MALTRVCRLMLVLVAAIAMTAAGGGVSAQDAPVIHVALSPFEAQSNVYYAQDLGLFKRAGLNIDIQQIPGSEAIVAGIIGGTLDIGTGNWLPLATANERGFDIVLVAPGTMSDAHAPRSGLIAVANSPLRTGRDLTGKTVGVNTLHSVNQLATQSWVDATGGDSRSVKFTEVPQTLMVAGLATGRLDAAFIADPAFSEALGNGSARNLAYANDAISKRFMITAWFANRAWANAHAEILHKYAAALNEASVWAVKNPAAAGAVLRKYLHVNVQLANEQHARSLDPALLQPLVDAAVKYKVLPKPLDARKMVWQ